VNSPSPLGAIAGGVNAGFNGGNILTGALRGAVAAAAFYGVGQAFEPSSFGHIVGSGLAGGVMNELFGGNFGHGFLSAGISAMASGTINGIKSAGGRIVASAIVGGTVSKLTGGKFANGAATAAFTWTLSQGAQRAQAARENRGGEWIFPEGGSTDMNDYDTVMTNGILGDREAFVLSVNKEQIPGYFNPSGGALADIGESFRQKFFGWAGDPLAEGFAEGLTGVDHPMRIVAHSQGTLTVANAARYYGLPEGSTLVMRSPAISRWRANAATNSIRGSMQYVQPYGDIANIYAPSLNPVRWLSGFGDVFCGACTHTANGLP